jgi:hypothetical protein
VTNKCHEYVTEFFCLAYKTYHKKCVLVSGNCCTLSEISMMSQGQIHLPEEIAMIAAITMITPSPAPAIIIRINIRIYV